MISDNKQKEIQENAMKIIEVLKENEEHANFVEGLEESSNF